MVHKYTSYWNMPTMGGEELYRSHRASEQIQNIQEVAEDHGLVASEESVTLDIYGEDGYTDMEIEDLPYIDFSESSLVEANVEYVDRMSSIEASYHRHSISPNFQIEVYGDEELRNDLQTETNRKITRTGLGRLSELLE